LEEEPRPEELLLLDVEDAFVPALLPREDALLRDAEPPEREPDVVLRELELRRFEEDDTVLRAEEAPLLFFVAFRVEPAAAFFEPALFLAVLRREPLPADALFPLVPTVFFAEAEPLEERDEEEPPADFARLPPLDLPAALRAVSPLISLLKLLFCPSAVVSW
jgi:hypothetical protein